MTVLPLRTELICDEAEAVPAACRIWSAGGLVAFPTETVYGLGADATNPAAVARIFAAKERPLFNPLISHVAEPAAAEALGSFDETARRLAAAFWPGPLTLIVPVRPEGSVCELARAGLDSVALRVPAHPLARRLLRAFGKPVVAPSANRSGHVSPTLASHVLADLDGRIELVIDGGATQVGLESSIVACLGGAPRLLRPGSITRQMIEGATGISLAGTTPEVDDATPLAPGMLSSHYATHADVRLDADEINPGEAVLRFGPLQPRGAEAAIASENLSESGDLVEAAANLYAMLRRLDSGGAATIAVMPLPAGGLGEAIRDRLGRAAAPRVAARRMR
jgi:L-threonylcarbamoyladenylate synthase